MKTRGIIVFVLTLILLAVCVPVKAFALKIDGALDDKDWEKAEKFSVVSSSDTPNCGVSYGIMYVFCDESESRIYIGFKAEVSDKIDENSVYGAAVSADSAEFIYVTSAGVSDYNTDKYSVEAKACSYSDSVFGVEIALGIKYGLHTVDTLRVRLVDASGSPSNIYTVKVPRGYLTEYEPITLPIYNGSGTVDDKPEVTTKERTTKAKTTKSKTTKVKTTKVKTTKPVESNKEDSLNNTGYAASEQTLIPTTYDPYGEPTTVVSVREFKLQKSFTYGAVCAMILLAIGICLAVNYARDKEKSKEAEKKDKSKKTNR